MLGKQWLNRYTSTDMRGSAIERSWSRQRKLDGIVAWYFDHVMGSLPLMLQAALLLLGSALSRYLWETSTTVAFVILGLTSFGILFYIFIVVAGAVTESCPYQTPGSPILRFLWQRGSSTFKNVLLRSKALSFIIQAWNSRPWSSGSDVVDFFLRLALAVPLGFPLDLYLLGRTSIQLLFALPSRAYHLVHRVRTWLSSIHPPPRQASDLRCISWTLQTSLDKLVYLSTLEYFITITNPTYIDPTLLTNCFNVLFGCFRFSWSWSIEKGSEKLAILSAVSFFRVFHLLSVMDPTSSVLADVRRQYRTCFPNEPNPSKLPFPSTFTLIRAMAGPDGHPRSIQWHNRRPSDQEHVPLARHIAEAAHVILYETQRRKLPRWILRFALHSLSLDPPPPPSVVADCLNVIAIDLGSYVSDTSTLNDEYVQIRLVYISLTQYQRASGANLELYLWSAPTQNGTSLTIPDPLYS